MGIQLYGMKTTIELPEELLLEGKRVALERKTTLKQLIVNGLKKEIVSPSDPNSFDPLKKLSSMDATLWTKENPDEYVKRMREGWL